MPNVYTVKNCTIMGWFLT